jgi:hypothetical protein
MIEPCIGQLQRQRILPVNASPYGIRCLSIGQTFGKLQQGRQRESCGRLSRLTAPGKQSRELLILKQRAQGVRHVHRQAAFRKGRPGDTLGLSRNQTRGLWVERHEENSIGVSRRGDA